MAKIIIILEDAGNDLVNYQSVCETPDEVNEKGEPTAAIKMAIQIIENMTSTSENNKVE
jgi:hypothetical protein